MLNFLFDILWFLILHIFYGTNDSLEGKICDPGEMLAGLKVLFSFATCWGSKLTSRTLCVWMTRPSVFELWRRFSQQWRACHASQEDQRSNPPKPLRQWELVTPRLEAETGVLRQDKERLFSFRETHLMYMLAFVSSVLLLRHACWRSGHLGDTSKRYWAGETAQSVKCLLCKHEDPRSVIRTQIRKLHVTRWHMPIIPSLMGGNTWVLGDSLASQPSKISELQVEWQPCFRNQEEWLKKTATDVLWAPHAFTCLCIHTQ